MVSESVAPACPSTWTSISGAEFERVYDLHFAGEHTSLDAQGFMEGGALSGAMVAQAILEAFGISTQADRTRSAQRIFARAKLARQYGSWRRAVRHRRRRVRASG